MSWQARVFIVLAPIGLLAAAQKDPAGCWGQIGGTPLITLPRS